MNKAELVDVIAAKTNVTKKDADLILSAMIQTIVEVVSGGDKVSLVGFGSFEPRQRLAREGRNPKTGEKMIIPATRVPGFAPGKLFKDKVAPNS
ncbi:MAG: DNA-binding protein HU [Chroococcidiopsis cubana SAG 39.79]|uniref:DNA-binding protein n=1 Tax=Chroococcidiopsis cubana SAG 39.79 TaxID=388085 RepID=A0AB37UCT8_9CYAN|nr:HU family DNA-binding protein [Chroococcidiopsis cubana]MDZ4871569.1 DNA-binding protein HU [Chroococcidiopsis cubana SAG 39.79]RUT05843.1 DNA-binding protein [Chroococcidiopsis cubana SAG 39.79]